MGAFTSCSVYELPTGGAPSDNEGGESASDGGASPGAEPGAGGSAEPGAGGSAEPEAGGSGPECGSAADCDDLDDCTAEVCAGGLCTYPANGSCTCAEASECDDENPCTDEACSEGACVYVNNTLPCDPDEVECTADACSEGICSHLPTSSCQCESAADCNDFNPCTDDSCVDKLCSIVANSAACTADLSPCTDDVCSEGACTHPDKGICSGSDLVAIRANRSKLYVALNGTFLEQSRATASDAEVFEKVEEVNYKLKLRAQSSGLFVTLGEDDQLVASADHLGATLFSASPCGTRRGLRAGNDDDGNAWVQARALDVDGRLAASVGACATDAGSWEQFELIPIGGPCSEPLDCDDGNECTSETCSAGFCVYSELGSACTDDLDACTDDVCDSGACTHPQNGTCPGTTVKIRANSNDNYVVLNASFLEHTGATFAAGEAFEQVTTAGGEFRLRAASTALFVRVDATENLIADADYANATVFSNPDCGLLGALVAESDDDTNNYLKAEVDDRIVADDGWCNPNDDGAWEKFELVLAP